ncbi:MAG: IS110 family transposase [Nitrososphaerota archaeon]|nr:IS110 family transposase [Nitrososphaerota archaeon]
MDLHQKTVQAVVKEEDGRIVKEAKLARDGKKILEFLDGTNAQVVMESVLNHQYIRDLLKENKYEVKVAHPLMVKAIAYARVKSDRVDSKMLADLLRAKMIPESYIPDKDVRDLRDLVRRRRRFVETRTMFKNRIRAELSKRWINYEGEGKLFAQEGKNYLHSLKIDAIDDYLDAVEYIDSKIREIDSKVRAEAENDEYAKLLVTVPGFSYYGALLVSSEIANIERFSDYSHLASYARLAPATHQSRDTNYTTQHNKKMGSAMLSWIMIQCTRSHVRTCESAVTKHYNEVRKRRGEKVAIVAAARKLMRAMYVMLKENQTFRLDG